jgi:hypothetical protein
MAAMDFKKSPRETFSDAVDDARAAAGWLWEVHAAADANSEKRSRVDLVEIMIAVSNNFVTINVEGRWLGLIHSG